MQKPKLNEKLLDLSPRDLEIHSPAELQARLVRAGVDPEDSARELGYLRQISRRRVRMPSEAYFAGARQRIYERIATSNKTIWSRVSSLLAPVFWRPIPAAVAALVIAVAVLTPILYYNLPTLRLEMPILESAGRYVSMSEVYAEHVVTVDEQVISASELREYREILIMSTAILGSPSSLSRSRSLAGSHE